VLTGDIIRVKRSDQFGVNGVRNNAGGRGVICVHDPESLSEARVCQLAVRHILKAGVLVTAANFFERRQGPKFFGLEQYGNRVVFRFPEIGGRQLINFNVCTLWVTVLHDPLRRLEIRLGFSDTGIPPRLRVFCFVCAILAIVLSIYLFILR
jgi:hypothetical protein